MIRFNFTRDLPPYFPGILYVELVGKYVVLLINLKEKFVLFSLILLLACGKWLNCSFMACALLSTICNALH